MEKSDGREKECIFLTEDTRPSDRNPFRASPVRGTNLKRDEVKTALVSLAARSCDNII